MKNGQKTFYIKKVCEEENMKVDETSMIIKHLDHQSGLWRRTDHGISRTASFSTEGPTLLVFKLKTHLVAGNRESKGQGFNDHTFLAGRNPCRGPGVFETCAISTSIESIAIPERLKKKTPSA
jgi:hypothetical protein